MKGERKAAIIAADPEQNEGYSGKGKPGEDTTPSLRTIVSVEEFKIEAEQEKLDGSEQIEDVQKWGEEIEANTEEADTEILNLQRHLDDAAAKRKTEKKAIEDALVAQRCHEQLQFEKLQLQQTMVVNKPEEKQRVRSPSLTEL